MLGWTVAHKRVSLIFWTVLGAFRSLLGQFLEPENCSAKQMFDWTPLGACLQGKPSRWIEDWSGAGQNSHWMMLSLWETILCDCERLDKTKKRQPLVCLRVLPLILWNLWKGLWSPFPVLFSCFAAWWEGVPGPGLADASFSSLSFYLSRSFTSDVMIICGVFSFRSWYCSIMWYLVAVRICSGV